MPLLPEPQSGLTGFVGCARKRALCLARLRERLEPVERDSSTCANPTELAGAI